MRRCCCRCAGCKWLHERWPPLAAQASPTRRLLALLPPARPPGTLCVAGCRTPTARPWARLGPSACQQPGCRSMPPPPGTTTPMQAAKRAVPLAADPHPVEVLWEDDDLIAGEGAH